MLAGVMGKLPPVVQMYAKDIRKCIAWVQQRVQVGSLSSPWV